MKENSGAGAHALGNQRREVLGGVGQRRDALFASFDALEALGHGREVAGGLEDRVGEFDGQGGLHDDERPLDLGAHRAGDVHAVGRVRVEEVAALLFRARDLGEALTRDGSFDLSGTPEFAALRDTYGFISGTSTHADRLAEIARTEKESGYLLDPHTADGVHVARAVRPQIEGPLVVMETALPVKFADTILEATGHLPPVPERFEGIEGREERVTPLANSAEDLKALIRERVRPGA